MYIYILILYIGAGSLAVESFKQVLGLFAAILLYSSYKILFQGEEDEEEVRDYPLDSLLILALFPLILRLIKPLIIPLIFPLFYTYFNIRIIGYS